MMPQFVAVVVKGVCACVYVCVSVCLSVCLSVCVCEDAVAEEQFSHSEVLGWTLAQLRPL